MTNEEIIMGARISLMEAGLIGTTGRILTAEINGEKKEFHEPERFIPTRHGRMKGTRFRKARRRSFSW
ncbi:MAG: hypothetical protein IJU50_00030 [Lachnospiraceae bacterium]|nr:hypothetical protein [Lachnospiraceae bacterium]